MKSEVRIAPVFRNILYAQAWEDPEIDREALRIGPGDDVFAICASGDNALAFLIDDPRSVLALDFNLTQCCLLELKIAAIRTLPRDELLELLGVRSPERAPELYRRHVRAELSDRAREYWDAHTEQLRAGVIHAGRFEHYFAIFRRWVLPWIASRDLVGALLACREPAEQRELYDRRWNTWRWRLLFRLFFSRTLMGLLGRDPAMFKYVEGRVSEAILARAEHGLTAIPARTNWFLEYIARGGYAEPDGERLPLYLQSRWLPVIRKRLDRLAIVNDEIEAFLPTCDEDRFSAWYLSDIFEYMSEKATEALLTEIWRTSRDGARLSYREMMVPRAVPASLAERLVEDPALGARLHERDRSFFYGAHHVVTVRKRSPAATP